jgi:outer membrane protein
MEVRHGLQLIEVISSMVKSPAIEVIKKNITTKDNTLNMKKGTLIFNGAVVVVLVVLIWLHYRSSSIVYVDTNRLMMNYEGMIDANEEFDKKANAWQAQSDTLLIEWENQIKTYEKERKTMTVKERQLKEELLRNKQQQIKNYWQVLDKKRQDEEQKLTKKAIDKANNYITEYGKKHGYKLILGANGSGAVLYGSKGIEITDIILEGLNNEYKKK